MVFLRLFEDVVDELNKSVKRRISSGSTKAQIADRGDIDPAVLSRTLRGRSGTNLRTIAAVLAGTDHRFKIVSVPCEELNAVRVLHTRNWHDAECYHYVETDGVWQEPLTEIRVPKITFYSKDLVDG